MKMTHKQRYIHRNEVAENRLERVRIERSACVRCFVGMMYFVNVFVEKRSMEKPVRIVEAKFLENYGECKRNHHLGQRREHAIHAYAQFPRKYLDSLTHPLKKEKARKEDKNLIKQNQSKHLPNGWIVFGATWMIQTICLIFFLPDKSRPFVEIDDQHEAAKRPVGEHHHCPAAKHCNIVLREIVYVRCPSDTQRFVNNCAVFL